MSLLIRYKIFTADGSPHSCALLYFQSTFLTLFWSFQSDEEGGKKEIILTSKCIITEQEVEEIVTEII